MPWSISRIERTETSPDRATTQAAVVVLKRDGAEHRIVVELAGTAAASGVPFNPREAVSGFLNDEEPPKRLIVTTDGVSVADS